VATISPTKQPQPGAAAGWAAPATVTRVAFGNPSSSDRVISVAMGPGAATTRAGRNPDDRSSASTLPFRLSGDAESRQ
jgi:hypothetical protein